MEKGIWRDADLQAQELFKDVGFPKKELEGGLLMAATGPGAGKEFFKKHLGVVDHFLSSGWLEREALASHLGGTRSTAWP